MAAPPACFGARRTAMTPLPAVRTAMAGASGGRRSAGATPRVTRSSSLRSVVSEPRRGRNPRNRSPRGSPDFERPRRSPRLQSQKENDPSPSCAAPSPSCAAPSPPCAPSPSCAAPSPPASPLPSPLPRVRRSYSRLEGAMGGLSPRGGLPLNPLPLNVPLPPPEPRAPQPPQIPPLGLPGIGPVPPERRRKRKVTPIDVSELEAWAASMNALFEEAERFHLVVE